MFEQNFCKRFRNTVLQLYQKHSEQEFGGDANAGQVQFGDELIKQNSLVLAGKEGRKEALTKTRK